MKFKVGDKVTIKGEANRGEWTIIRTDYPFDRFPIEISKGALPKRITNEEEITLVSKLHKVLE